MYSALGSTPFAIRHDTWLQRFEYGCLTWIPKVCMQSALFKPTKAQIRINVVLKVQNHSHRLW